ncbi:uncharacterized protein LOC135223185 [Macrobrachium nipponense]|uniref:uncharacterized protein LOC135223185 n=1 Tax=Macrobrachium nipponense TaxID=159736 RepID=UPI0030C85D9D
MKVLIVASLCVAVVLGQTRIPPKPTTRKLPADILRDFPGACFASTACRVFKVGESWPLTPFCGKATCVKEGERLLEQVEDCGVRPKETPGCRIANEADLTKAFPACCPVYECQEGATLQFPTEEELKAAAQEAAARAASALQGPQSPPAAPAA